MLVLALDTSSAAVVAAVAEVGAVGETGAAGAVADGGVRVIAERSPLNPRGHTELLAPSIAACLEQAGIAPAGLGAVVAGLGPGPFTGLRVGLVTAAAIAQALEVPSYGVCSLDAIAVTGTGPGQPGTLLVATDARRHELYWALYRGGERVDGPHVSRPGEIPTAGVEAVAGAGAALYEAELGLPLLHADPPGAAALVGLAAARIRAAAPSEALVPLYLRRPDAVPGAGSRSVLQ